MSDMTLLYTRKMKNIINWLKLVTSRCDFLCYINYFGKFRQFALECFLNMYTCISSGKMVLKKWSRELPTGLANFIAHKEWEGAAVARPNSIIPVGGEYFMAATLSRMPCETPMARIQRYIIFGY